MSIKTDKFPKELRPVANFAKKESIEDSGYRPFPVTSEDFVELPGCTKVEAVNFGGQEIPEFEDIEILTSTAVEGGVRESQRHYLWSFIENREGVPGLIRSARSNNGLWQTHDRLGNPRVIHVKGEFAS